MCYNCQEEMAIGTDRPDILMKLFEDYIFILYLAAWILFNFHLKQKKSFSVWSFTENASFISFHEGIWSVTKAH